MYVDGKDVPSDCRPITVELDEIVRDVVLRPVPVVHETVGELGYPDVSVVIARREAERDVVSEDRARPRLVEGAFVKRTQVLVREIRQGRPVGQPTDFRGQLSHRI